MQGRILKLLKSIFIFIVTLSLFSCSKKIGNTFSTVKILSANYTALLTNQANNGLIFYGINASDPTKSFLKKISGDSINLILPNGKWNFYAIGWGMASSSSSYDFMGKVSCAKNIGLDLNGTDVKLTMTLSNGNCDSSFSVGSKPILIGNNTENVFEQLDFHSCKNVSLITAENVDNYCNTYAGTKGNAHYIKLIIPEYQKVGIGSEVIVKPALSTQCISIDPNSTYGNPNESDYADYLNLYNIPNLGVNGLDAKILAYYGSNGCDDSENPDAFDILTNGKMINTKMSVLHLPLSEEYKNKLAISLNTSMPDARDFIDNVTPTSFNSPGNEMSPNAVDGNQYTKYLNFDKLNSGFTIHLSEPKVVVGIKFTTANDAWPRDPASFSLYGSNDGDNWTTVIENQPITLSDNRFTESSPYKFNNASTFSYYRLIFPTVKKEEWANSMQIGEVNFLLQSH